jgi:hypothetical protein
LPPSSDTEKHFFSLFEKLGNDEHMYKGLRTALIRCKEDKKFSQFVLNPKIPIGRPQIPLDEKGAIELISGDLITAGLLESLHSNLFQFRSGGKARPVFHTAGTEFNPEEDIYVVRPNICKIEGLRRSSYVPPPKRWHNVELDMHCQLNVDNNIDRDTALEEASIRCEDPRIDSQLYRCHGEIAPTGDPLCLRTPSVNSGDTVTLEGFNFVGRFGTVRIRKVKITMEKLPNNRYPAAYKFLNYTMKKRKEIEGEWEIPTTIIGDTHTPETIIDCKAEDKAIFQLPLEYPGTRSEFLPGDYEICLEVPNPDGKYHNYLGEPEIPEKLRSRWHPLIVRPKEDITYRITLDRLRCIEETDGAFGSTWGSDEVALTVLTGLIRKGSDPSRPEDFVIESPDVENPIWRDKDVNSGSPWLSIDKIIHSGQMPDVLAFYILGHEVDSEKAYKEQLDSFGKNFKEIWKTIFEFVVKNWAAISKGIEELASQIGNYYTVIVVAVIAVITLAITIFIALWAPPDLIIADMISLTPEQIHFLTWPENPLPPSKVLPKMQGIRRKVDPINKIGNLYRERRWYRSNHQDSRYEMDIKLERTD